MDTQGVGYESEHTVLANMVGQQLLPDYAGEYAAETVYEKGLQPFYASLNPAPGSVDLIEPRSTGGVPGTARISNLDGPVRGKQASWSGVRDLIPANNSNPVGPVRGGIDQTTARMLAYETSLIQTITQEQSDAMLAQGF